MTLSEAITQHRDMIMTIPGVNGVAIDGTEVKLYMSYLPKDTLATVSFRRLIMPLTEDQFDVTMIVLGDVEGVDHG